MGCRKPATPPTAGLLVGILLRFLPDRHDARLTVGRLIASCGLLPITAHPCRPEPTVRIQLSPAASQQRTVCLSLAVSDGRMVLRDWPISSRCDRTLPLPGCFGPELSQRGSRNEVALTVAPRDKLIGMTAARRR
jgi:hypothetical protein